MSPTVVSASVKPRKLVISDVQKGTTKNDISQIAMLIPFDSLSNLFNLRGRMGDLDSIIDTINHPLYSNFDFNIIDPDKEYDVQIIVNGIEYDCVISRHDNFRGPFSYILMREFDLKKKRTTA